jgi:hypothetical protein
MSASLKSNVRNLASTPSIEPPPQSEHELLKLREANAKAALRTTFQELGHKLKSLIDLGPTVREHPWKSSGIAALAGFVVALKVVPASGEASQSVLPEAEKKPSGASPWSAIASTLVDTGGGAVKAALMPWLIQKIQDLMPKNEPPVEEPRTEDVPFSP